MLLLGALFVFESQILGWTNLFFIDLDMHQLLDPTFCKVGLSHQYSGSIFCVKYKVITRHKLTVSSSPKLIFVCQRHLSLIGVPSSYYVVGQPHLILILGSIQQKPSNIAKRLAASFIAILCYKRSALKIHQFNHHKQGNLRQKFVRFFQAYFSSYF